MQAKKARKSIYKAGAAPTDPPTHFSIGVWTSADAARRSAERLKAKRKARLSALQKCPISGCECVVIPPFVPKTWFLIPHSRMDSTLNRMMNAIGTSLKEAKEKLKYYSREMDRQMIPDDFVYRMGYARMQSYYDISPLYLRLALAVVNLNERIRRTLSKLVRRLRRRHMRRANEEDLITMELPVKEVVVYDWLERRTYHFEATTIMRCITRRILSHEGLFVNVLEPSNPYTNVQFTLGQMHSIVGQLVAHGIIHWCTDGLRSVAYDLALFKIIHDKPLRFSALKATFTDLTNTEMQDTLLDFIESEYNMHSMVPNSDLYAWAVKHAIEHPHMREWRRLCYDYYSEEIVYDNIPIRLKLNRLKVSSRAKGLCRLPLSLRLRFAERAGAV